MDTEPNAYQSIDLVGSELDRRVTEQTQRQSAFDTRAGFILGLAGVLISLAADRVNALSVAAQLAGAVAMGFAIWALSFRAAGSLEPRQVRERYLTASPNEAKLRILDTRIWLFEQDEERFEGKVRRMRWAQRSLGVSVLLIVAGSIVNLIS